MKRTAKETRVASRRFWITTVCRRLKRLVADSTKDMADPDFQRFLQGLDSLADGIIEAEVREVPYAIILAHQPGFVDFETTDEEYGNDD